MRVVLCVKSKTNGNLLIVVSDERLPRISDTGRSHDFQCAIPRTRLQVTCYVVAGESSALYRKINLSQTITRKNTVTENSTFTIAVR